MSSNANAPFSAASVLLFGGWAICLLLGIVLLIVSVIRKKKTGDTACFSVSLIALICVITVTASWFTNFGWLRLAASLMPVHLAHTVAFVVILYLTAPYIRRVSAVKTLTVIACVTYLTGYLLLPDGSDDGPMYTFFGLIRNDAVGTVCGSAAAVMLIASVIVLIVMLIWRGRIRRAEAKKEE